MIAQPMQYRPRPAICVADAYQMIGKELINNPSGEEEMLVNSPGCVWLKITEFSVSAYERFRKDSAKTQGMIRLNSLRLKLSAQRRRKLTKHNHNQYAFRDARSERSAGRSVIDCGDGFLGQLTRIQLQCQIETANVR